MPTSLPQPESTQQGAAPAGAVLMPPAALRALAAQQGFDDVRVTHAEPESAAGVHFRAWLEQGRHADMQWMAREPERRIEPRRHLPAARSVITLAVNHYRLAPAPARGQGRVARYAAGEDYHRVMERGLKGLVAELNRRDTTGAYRFYVDYGPVLERAFAERAGLGFIGRSACLIHPTYGTYVFLATIITDARLAPDAPAPGTCGQCRRCLDVCPTGALRSPYEIDARLCISYLTIENRGPIPRHLRPLIGNWIFGCDLCQEVCPYNGRATPGRNARIAGTTIAGTEIDLVEVLALRTEEAFAVRFAQSPVRRAKREGLLRNAAVVAGNLRHPPLLPVLRATLAEDVSPLVRGHAVWALTQYADHASIRSARAREHDPFVLAEIEASAG